MDGPRFDALTRLLDQSPSRRAAIAFFTSLGTATFAGITPGETKKKKKKKTTLCLDGQTIQASKKKKKKLLKSGATPGACSPPPPGCTPVCAGKPCGSDDGCGGTCGCAPGSLCHGGICRPCDVICDGNGTACGDALQPLLNGGGTIVACPGRYVGNFSFSGANISLIGAGDGGDPTVDTILDANNSGRVVHVNPGVSAVLQRLRITGGSVDLDNGGGIRNEGALLVTDCTIDKNVATIGGGIENASIATSLTLNRCTVSRNVADLQGGGIFTEKALTIKGSAITGNNAELLGGGGVYVQIGLVTFDSASSVTGNTCDTADCVGGIFNFNGTVVLNSATVSGNDAPQCFDVPGC